MTVRISGRVGFGRSNFELVYRKTLAASGNFDITNIPLSYSHLYGTLLCRSDVVATLDFMHVFFNGDTTQTNYRRGSHEGGTSHVSAASDNAVIGECTGASSPADYFGYLEFNIPLYAGSHEKIITSLSYTRQNATIIAEFMFFVQWENPAAINQITLQPDGFGADEFIADSQLSIWGYR